MEITLPNSQGNQSFRSVAGKRSNGRAVYLGDPRLALLGRSPVGVEKSALTTPCPVAAGSVFSGKVQVVPNASNKSASIQIDERAWSGWRLPSPEVPPASRENAEARRTVFYRSEQATHHAFGVGCSAGGPLVRQPDLPQPPMKLRKITPQSTLRGQTLAKVENYSEVTSIALLLSPFPTWLPRSLSSPVRTICSMMNNGRPFICSYSRPKYSPKTPNTKS